MNDKERLEELSNWLGALDLHCDIIEKSEAMPLDVLLAYLGDDKDQERFMQFAYLPISKDDVTFTKLLQLYSVLPERATDDTVGELMVILNKVNNMTMLGYFGIGPDYEVFFRYVHAMPAILDSEVSFQEMVNLSIISIKMFEEVISPVASGKIGVEKALDSLAEM